jgi:hypothetical protein
MINIINFLLILFLKLCYYFFVKVAVISFIFWTFSSKSPFKGFAIFIQIFDHLLILRNYIFKNSRKLGC